MIILVNHEICLVGEDQWLSTNKKRNKMEYKVSIVICNLEGIYNILKYV